MLDPEFERLLSRLCDGLLSDAELHSLGERITRNPAERRAYLHYLDLHAALQGETPFARVTAALGQVDLQAQVDLAPQAPARGGRSRLASRAAGWAGLALAGVSLAAVLLVLGGLGEWNWNQPRAGVAAVAPAPAGQSAWAKITDVVGSVELAGMSQPLLSGADLAEDQTVRTGGDDSYAVIELTDGSRLLLCPESQLRLTRNARAPAQMRLVLSSGVLEAEVPRSRDDRQLIVVTPQVEIATRETRCVVSAPDASSTAIETSQGQVSVLRTADGRQAEVPAGYYMVALHQQQEFTVRPTAQLPTQPHAQLALEQARTIAFHGEREIVAASAAQVAAFDRQTNALMQFSPLDKDSSQMLVSAAHSGLIGQIDRAGLVRIFAPEDGSAVTTLETGIRNSLSAALNQTGDLLALTDQRSGRHSAARIWDLSIPTERPAIEIAGSIRQLTLSRDGRRVALAIERSKDFNYPRLEIWEVSPPALGQRIPLAERPLRVLAFSPDGDKLAGADDRGNAIVWDAASGAVLRQRGHGVGWTQPLTALAFDPTGELLAAGTNNGRVRLWNVKTGDEPGVLTCGQRIISALAFSPDGQELAVAAVRGKMLLYRLPVVPAPGPQL